MSSAGPDLAGAGTQIPRGKATQAGKKNFEAAVDFLSLQRL